MGLKIVRNGNKIRRNIAEYILNCPEEELFSINDLLENGKIECAFSCEECGRKYGNCDIGKYCEYPCMSRFIVENSEPYEESAGTL